MRHAAALGGGVIAGLLFGVALLYVWLMFGGDHDHLAVF